MNKKKEIPVKFIGLNILAGLGLIVLLQIIEPVQGTVIFFLFFTALLIFFAISKIIEKLIDKSPPSIRAIRDALSEYWKYLYCAIIGVVAYRLAEESKDVVNPILYLAFVIAFTAICYVITNYKKHYKKQKDQNS